ncbi:hypothetical protein TREMEDRAFT_25761 [Tremella mesenterica DSM 1558]|uniref:uncharacterized protein n=1 Tax=Tremella mesenterica (strain ATCC 24925 / CBS 8224 / DSM 1558 / NBRC 9311 / NRRL Y-6157 / RJB 2259-6 / UBC 559-6) TaxID=578456 RepID=UPI0003F498DD|nr:uncharacterized protein TREMEDRAFT_25761 [Tremella mesenterica DSM 1558]EIW72654.1 hypothetical protein TREMEDRAFT_25761 [Tremella mesenterica DSM 1558]
MLSPATTPPTYISPEDHAALTSSTPGSFVDIPPILRWADEVEISMEPQDGGWEGWDRKVKGKLWVTEELVAFIPLDISKIGFNLSYLALTLHALVPSSDETPSHIYCQIDESDAPQIRNGHVDHAQGNENGNVEGDGEEGEGGNEFTPMREIKIFVDSDKLQTLFLALSQCSALHDNIDPDPDSEGLGFGFLPSMPDGDFDDDEEEEDEDGNGRVRRNLSGPNGRYRPY